MSGKGCRYFENRDKSFDWKSFLYVLLYWDCSIARIDIAIDEFDNLLDLDRILKHLENGLVLSRFRTYKPEREFGLQENNKNSDTIYFGKRISNCMFRLYDKKLELQSKGIECTYDNWKRFEIVLKDEHAENFIIEFTKKENFSNLGFLAVKVINNYIRFLKENKTESNKARWQNAKWWDEFIMILEKVKLTKKKQLQTVDEIYFWIEKSVAPSLKLLVQANEGDFGVIDDLVMNAELSEKQITILKSYLQSKKQAVSL